MMGFTPFIHFQGTCAAAMTFYHDVFGGTLTLHRFSDMPGGPPEFAGSDLVMNAQLTCPTGDLMGSDFPPGQAGKPQQAITIAHTAADLAGAQRVFDQLAQDGIAKMPFAQTFWSPGFGMVTDRFGTNWTVSVPDPG
ncbi:VOC family protein [Pseudorhodobacter sp.]|uniref:VOC family protein n=1 Tax=Pseudorhodobacter sp. TaxID=1934400 RepID=UPI00264899DC|nr:VOC family protein [Pseudorhodobacter sp.]MDN5787063.1 VOC family protein [Pseudorhodobacter sp.]